MRKRITRKHHTRTRRRTRHSSDVSFYTFRYIVIAVAVVAFLIVVGGNTYSALKQTNVLGLSTLLADHGSDSGGSSGSDSSKSSGDSSGSGSSGSGSSGGSSGSGDSSGSGGSGSSGESSGGSGSGGSTTVSNNTKGDCVGPDGKHFTTSFRECSQLSNFWGKSNFSFTPSKTSNISSKTKSSSQAELKTPKIQETETKLENEKEKEEANKFEVKTEEGKTRIRIEQEGRRVEIRNENGKLVVKIKIKNPDGTEVENEEVENEAEDVLEQVNEGLAENEIEVGTPSAGGVNRFRKGNFGVRTHFPLSVDLVTKQLIVTTPAGAKAVAVLPDVAIENLLAAKVLSTVDASASSSLTSTAGNEKIELVLTNNQLVFKVKGKSHKRLLGVAPVSISKTAFVSAQTGTVVKTEESLFDRILDALSF